MNNQEALFTPLIDKKVVIEGNTQTIVGVKNGWLICHTHKEMIDHRGDIVTSEEVDPRPVMFNLNRVLRIKLLEE